MLPLLSATALIRLFPSTIINQQSSLINLVSTPRFAGQANATAYGRVRSLRKSKRVQVCILHVKPDANGSASQVADFCAASP